MIQKLLATLLFCSPILASVGCVSQPKDIDKNAKLATFERENIPASAKKVNINFDDQIELIGYQVTPKGEVKPKQQVTVKMYWRVNKKLSKKGWSLFTHVMGNKNKRLLNIDEVGPLRDPKRVYLKPYNWKEGGIYEDKQTFKVPVSAKGQTLKFTAGFWRGSKRLKLTSGPNIGEDRGLIAKIRVAGGRKISKRIPTLRVNKLKTGVKLNIDGQLTEKAWASAPSTGAFVNVTNGKADPAIPVQGSAKLLWDDKNLYVGFDVKDTDVVGGFKKTDSDPHLWTKDTVEIMVDPDGNGDNKDYYEIQVNPQNLVFDSRFDSYNKPRGGNNGPFGHQDWSAKLTSAVTLRGTLDNSKDKDEGYVVEIAIPWKSFDKARSTPPKLGQQWRMNFYAMQNNGGVAWSPILGKGNFHRASRFGRIIFAQEGWKATKKSMLSTSKASKKTLRTGAHRLGHKPKPMMNK